METASYEIPKLLRDKFTAAVRKQGETASGVLRAYMMAYIADKAKKQADHNKHKTIGD